MLYIQEVTFTGDTLDFICDELNEILKHCDLSETMADEIADFLDALENADEIRVRITP